MGKPFALVAAITVGTVGRPSAAEPLTIDRAVQLALAHNERAGITALDVTVAEAGVAKARAAFLPVLGASGGETYTPFDKSSTGKPSTNDLKGSLTLTQPLVAPSALPLYDQAKHSLDAQEAQTVDDRRQLAFDTAKAYIAVLLADEVVQAAQKKLETARADVADTNAQVKAQLTSSNDVTRANISLAGSVHELAADQGNLDAAYVALELLVVSPVPRGLSSPAALLAASGKPLPPIDTLVAAGLKRRPDLAAKKASALAAHDFAREPRYRTLPTVSAQAATNGDSAGTKDGHDVDMSLGLTASWTLYDAGVRYADARSRDAQAAIADLETRALERSIDAQVRSAAAQLAASQQALAAARDAVTASQKSADETAILYHQGLAKAIELVDANEQRFLAEVTYAESEFSLASAYFALLQAMGRGPLELEVP
jgi:outer membrane protein TolC